MKNKKGISLIVLIITIIVVIILAAVVILTLSKNNPIESAKEARFKEDIRTFQDELALTVSKQYADAGGNRDEKITTSDFDEIKRYIPSFSEKYKNKFVIKNDELVPIDEDELNALKFLSTNISPEINYLIQNGIEIKDNYIDIDREGRFSKLKQQPEYKLKSTNYISSSVFNSGYAETQAFDNNINSYWCTLSGKGNDAYIGGEFEEAVDIFYVSFLSDQGYKCKEIKLQCSNDNNTWLDASDIVYLNNINGEKIIFNTKQNNSFKYWRVYIISTYNNYATASEIKFYGGKPKINNYFKIENFSEYLVKLLIYVDAKLEIDDVITYNFLDKLKVGGDSLRNYLLNINIIEKLKNKKISLVSDLSNNNRVLSSSIFSGGYDAYMAFDSKYNTYWCTENGKINNQFIGYIFDKDTYIYYADINSYEYRPKEVKLQCSSDNDNWIDASDVITLENNNNTHTIESNIKDRAYKYWRLYVISAYRTDYIGIYELNFYGI